jgi:hypothetical protein
MWRTLSIVGTGIRPMDFRTTAGGGSCIFRNFICPACHEPASEVVELGRDYLSILYFPLFPLSLCGLCESGKCDIKLRWSLSPDDKDTILSMLNSWNRSSRNLGIWGSWWMATLFALAGGGAGWFWISRLFHLGLPGWAIFLLLLIPVYFHLLYNLGEGLGEGIMNLTSKIKLGSVWAYLDVFFDELLFPMLGLVTAVVLTLHYAASYPQVAGLLWGMILMNGIFHSRIPT